jgi:hypothetical protein
MSLKLKRHEVNLGLINALEEVGKVEMDAALSYNASRIKRKAGIIFKENQDKLKEKLLEAVLKDEKGIPQFNTNEAGQIVSYKFTSPEAEKEFNDFEQSFLIEEVEIKSYPITLDSLSGGKIAPNTLENLEPVLFVESEAHLDA